MAKKPSYEDRARNFYGHEAKDLKTREELLRRGVKRGTKGLPSANYTHEGMSKTLRASDKRKNHLNRRLSDIIDEEQRKRSK